ncbi:carboxylesterase/lipase family protein [Mycolicibacterium fortuitum]|uniref:Carboxylic ester hydrolase n=1 Tax=Mycolicibacterium fortuitum TaxID=1766 RepID=A0AAE5ACH9_MYCFO|nr:carboxylesterase/lipase family protein [Mycolicibacterium fortuitum]MDV7190692.1 carboxylesterase/lipase family protein [Mycolicibacterium fortuitum]MDV7203941.1 carboxylesterase/lipase family protein [Mycolicibacterium fortuitum]MDV7225262.1 carboxylesterase/lipase family protein [Mycolicibacterium fortuitum]MDV7257926.1 carboxylesterase/lipase family protein [Mycolicibacterium fortuitum]MDV7282878.1 carboxylesterase/lipase family protein [Mycolicibacterium fortuitum]
MTDPTHARTRGGPVVDTGYGPVRGTDDGAVRRWLGIRYAAAPTGELRWRSPQPPARNQEVTHATAPGPVCPQLTDPRIPLDLGGRQGEDCLVLNVWAPGGTEPGAGKPVMVWVHGGAYVLGSGSQPLYDGSVLAVEGDAVVVTVNYRLGPFGFLDLSEFNGQPGARGLRFDTNVGLRDVLFALQWVRDNIAAFGGDPRRVTLFGESAGGGIITTLLASPAAEGLFSAAIAQSSPATSVYDAQRSRAVAHQFLERLGISDDEIWKLSGTPVPDILTAARQVYDAVPSQSPGLLAFAPIVDGELVPDYPVAAAQQGRTHPVPLIIGTNEHEATVFRWMKSPLMPITPGALRSMFAAIAAEQPGLQLPTEAQITSAYTGLRPKAIGLGMARDIGFRMPTLWFAEGHSAVAPVYLYRFDFTTPMLRLLRLGAAHATELPYVWGNLVAGPKDPTFKLGGLKHGRAVSERMRRRWVNFAASGQPSGAPGEAVWRPYRREDRATLLIDKQDKTVADLDRDLHATWGSQILSFR